MAIKAKCGSCGARFTAKDALAGKQVKCPKCSKPMRIPNPSAGATIRQVSPSTATVPANRGHNPLLDLLDEAGVESIPQGPSCQNCGAEIHPTAVVCVQCGFNMSTGELLETTVFEDEDDETGFDASGATDVNQILRKAEKEIDDMPVSAEGQDFGDGADSILIAAVALVILLVLVGIGVGTIFLMDQLTNVVSSAFVSFVASIGIVLMCITWITLVAFMADKKQGILCLVTLGLYCPVFGFMQGKSMMLPTIIMLAAFVYRIAVRLFCVS